MGRKLDLPLSPEWQSDDQYVNALLTFATSSDIFRHLCGGVHVLDFLTSEPDLYTQVLPPEWRDWFDQIEIWDLMRYVLHDERPSVDPPESLRDYVATVRKLCLVRDYCRASGEPPTMPRHISVGMKPKKIHEVSNFAHFVDELSTRVSRRTGEPVTLVDFGSGQNYLGRTLACPPYNKNVIAIERKHQNVQGARGMDVHAKLTKKEKIMRNKKEYKKKLATFEGLPTPPPDEFESPQVEVPDHVLQRLASAEIEELSLDNGSMTYVEYNISDGDLNPILYPSQPKRRTNTIDDPPETSASLPYPSQQTSTNSPNPSAVLSSHSPLLTISLHSCGNLSHHAIRSLTLTPSVHAIAIIGCCYNLLTERLGPATYKLPSLRPNHPRLYETSHAFDPHGFPMSRTLESWRLPAPESVDGADDIGGGRRGVRLNITARMMAVQAPYNWGREDSELFFTRHYYRALLQRILLDRGVVKNAVSSEFVTPDGNSLSSKDEAGTPLIVGSLKKSCFENFSAYVHGALGKLCSDTEYGGVVREKTRDLDDEVIRGYEMRYAYAKKDLSVMWTLMAFSAGVVESVIAVDRWLWLKEQDCVEQAWVQTVFEYGLSPRNLCVVGIKKVGEKGKTGGE